MAQEGLPPEPGSPQDPRTKVVLVVDDDDVICTLVSMALQMEGFQTVAAANGEEALKRMDDRAPDLIITDLMMPRQGGYEFLRHLNARGEKRVPVIIVTGHDLQDSTIELIRQEANVVEFLKKPLLAKMLAFTAHKTLGTTWKRPKSDPWGTRGA